MTRAETVKATLRVVRALAALGIGPRDSARLLHMTPSHVAYYRNLAGAKIPETPDLFARLPADVKAQVLRVREARTT